MTAEFLYPLAEIFFYGGLSYLWYRQGYKHGVEARKPLRKEIITSPNGHPAFVAYFEITEVTPGADGAWVALKINTKGSALRFQPDGEWIRDNPLGSEVKMLIFKHDPNE